jgi:predicted double-glycine peptidase
MTLKILDLEHCKQTTDYTCGPSTILSFLSYHNKKLIKNFTEMKLSKRLNTCPVVGTGPKQMYQLINKEGNLFNATHNTNLTHLENSINEEKPAIVLWFDEDEWHWSNVIGYDSKNIILLDPYLHEGIHTIEKSFFNKNWSKFAIR